MNAFVYARVMRKRATETDPAQDPLTRARARIYTSGIWALSAVHYGVQTAMRNPIDARPREANRRGRCGIRSREYRESVCAVRRKRRRVGPRRDRRAPWDVGRGEAELPGIYGDTYAGTMTMT